MFIEQIIKKAIEGGYASDRPEYARQHLITGFEGDFRFMVLDPLFWQALGKACGWNDDQRVELKGYVGDIRGGIKVPIDLHTMTVAQFWATRFHNIMQVEDFDFAIRFIHDVIYG